MLRHHIIRGRMTGHRSRAILKQMMRRIVTPVRLHNSLLRLLQDQQKPCFFCTHSTLKQSHAHVFRKTSSICPSSHSSIYVHPPPSALPCCSCVHYALMPQLNKSLGSGDFGGVTGLNWVEIKCPWIERRNSQHGDFHHPSTLIRVYESCLKASNIANTSRLQHMHNKLMQIDLASKCVFV